MPKIVNKEEKIDYICKKAYDIFVKVGIDNFSLNQFIKSINMSKGQFYHYFSTKEELVYTVMSKKTYELIENTLKEYQNKTDFIEKLNLLFAIYLSDDRYYLEFKKLIIDTIHLYINSKDPKIKEFNKRMYQSIFELLEELFEEEIKKGNFHPKSKHLAKTICATADGMFLQSLMIEDFNLKQELTNYFLEIKKLLEINLKG